MDVTYQKKLEKIKNIVGNHPRGTTIKEISNKIGLNRNVVAKYLDVLQIAGQVEMEKFGRSKVYFPSHSVPISTMFDFSYEFIVVVGNDMNIAEINTPFIKYFGLLKKEKVIGKSIKMLQLAKSYPKMTKNILEAFKSQEILEDKIKYRRKGSSKSDHFKVKFVPTTLSDGESGVTVILSKFVEK